MLGEPKQRPGRSPDARGRSGLHTRDRRPVPRGGVASATPSFIFSWGPRKAGGARREAWSAFQDRGVLKNNVFWGDNAIARPLRINDQIRIRQVRVIDENGEQLGILPTEDALARAKTAGLDLIEVSPTAQPPVCKIADYGRLKYEQSKKDKDARKKQRHFELREVKLRPKIETHDYETKARMAERLLLDGSKIKVTIMFRGREITYTSFGRRLLDRMAEDMAPLATVEREARLEGRNMFMILAPRATPTGAPKFSQHREKDPDKDEKPVTHDAAEMEERTSA
jgi:translation initiation factor IF-3